MVNMNINQTVKQTELMQERTLLKSFKRLCQVKIDGDIISPEDNVKKIKAIDERIEEINTLLQEEKNG